MEVSGKKQGALKLKKNADGGGWVLFLGISGPETTFSCSFFSSQDAPPQNTQRTSWLCLCVGGQEIPKFHTQRICLTDIKQGLVPKKQQVYVE
jgi:hypothetical protein